MKAEYDTGYSLKEILTSSSLPTPLIKERKEERKNK